MNQPRHIRRITFFILFISLGAAAMPQPTAMQSGRLVLLLHETGSAGAENQNKQEVGAVTMRAAIALAQEAGIIVTSPTIWANLLSRCASFKTASKKPGSLQYLFEQAWRLLPTNNTGALHTQIQAMLRTDPTLLHHSYISSHQPTADRWACYHHTQASLIILIPRSYSEQRLNLLPRNIPNSFSPIEYAVGLAISKCAELTLPPPDAPLEGLHRLISQAHHLIKRSTFSVNSINTLFITSNSIHPLLSIPWNIYMVGHGTYKQTESPWGHLEQFHHQTQRSDNKMICGIPAADFSQFIMFCNAHLTINCFYYQSCYGGQRQSTPTTSNPLHFPLIIGAVGEAPVHVLMPRSSGSGVTVDTNIAGYFEALERNESSWPAILSPITPLLSLPSDLHSISSTPLLVPANQTQPLPIDVNQDKQPTSSSISKNKIRAGITLFSTADQAALKHSGKPFVIRGQRAVLLSPPIITTPLEIHPYQRIVHQDGTTKTIFLAPALLSINPGNSLHHCSCLTAHSINFHDFLLQSFLQLTKQQSTKVFLFDSLTVNNDLADHFTHEDSSWWSQVTGAIASWLNPSSPLSSSRITLQKLVIVVGPQRLTCIFLEPGTNETVAAYKVIYYRPTTTESRTPERLIKEQVLIAKHTALYKKYTSLCAKQH